MLIGTGDGTIRQLDMYRGVLLDNAKYRGRFDPRGSGIISGQTSPRGRDNKLSVGSGTHKKKWHLLEEVVVDWDDFQAATNAPSQRPRGTAKTLYSKKEPVKGKDGNSISRWFVAVQSYWVGVIEVRSDGAVSSHGMSPYIYTQCKGIGLIRETLSACLTFLDNTPCAMIIQRGGHCETYALHNDTEGSGGLTVSLVDSVQALSNLPIQPANRRNTILDQLNLYAAGWDAHLVMTRKDKTNLAPVYWCDITAPHRVLEAGWRQMVTRKFRTASWTYARNSRIGEASGSTSLPSRLFQSGDSDRDIHKPKHSSIWSKMTKWATSGAATVGARRPLSLRTFTSSPSRDFSAAAMYRARNQAIPTEFSDNLLIQYIAEQHRSGSVSGSSTPSPGHPVLDKFLQTRDNTTLESGSSTLSPKPLTGQLTCSPRGIKNQPPCVVDALPSFAGVHHDSSATRDVNYSIQVSKPGALKSRNTTPEANSCSVYPRPSRRSSFKLWGSQSGSRGRKENDTTHAESSSVVGGGDYAISPTDCHHYHMATLPPSSTLSHIDVMDGFESPTAANSSAAFAKGMQSTKSLTIIPLPHHSTMGPNAANSHKQQRAATGRKDQKMDEKRMDNSTPNVDAWKAAGAAKKTLSANVDAVKVSGNFYKS